MDFLISVVAPALIFLLMTNFLRLFLPKECYIWFRSKYPLGTRLINIAATIPIMFWMLLVSVLLSGYNPVDLWDALSVWAFGLVPPVLLVLAKVLVTLLWKPTPEMLAYNDRVVAEELSQVEQDSGLSQPEAEQAGRCWQCKNCGSRNDERENTCLHCGIPAALWEEKPDSFTEDEQ